MRTVPAIDLTPEVRAEVLYATAVTHWLGTGEWPAALYVLAFPYLLFDKRVWRHVEVAATEEWLGAEARRIAPTGEWEAGEAFVTSIDLAAMLGEGTWSSGERLLIEVALSLFNGSVSVNVSRLQFVPDDWSDRILEALAIFVGRQRWSSGTLEQLRQSVAAVPA